MMKKALAIEALICRYADNAFCTNGIPPEMAALIMRSVCTRFEKLALDKVLVEQIEVPPAAEQEEKEQSEKKTISPDVAKDMVNELQEFYGGSNGETGEAEE